MSWGDPPISGFEVLEEISEGGLYYAFNIMALWRETATGALFFGTDSGCSCPSPWDRTSESDLTPITRETFDEFERAVNDFPAALDERRDLIARAREVLS